MIHVFIFLFPLTVTYNIVSFCFKGWLIAIAPVFGSRQSPPHFGNQIMQLLRLKRLVNLVYFVYSCIDNTPLYQKF